MPEVEIPQKTTPTELGNRIAQIRKQAGLSQAGLAKKLGVTQQVIAAWERKLTGIHSDNLIKLSHALEVPADIILGLTEPKNQNDSSQSIHAKLLKKFNQLRDLPDKDIRQIIQYANTLLEKEALRKKLE